jgi:hypothetical protein
MPVNTVCVYVIANCIVPRCISPINPVTNQNPSVVTLHKIVTILKQHGLLRTFIVYIFESYSLEDMFLVSISYALINHKFVIFYYELDISVNYVIGRQNEYIFSSARSFGSQIRRYNYLERGFD